MDPGIVHDFSWKIAGIAGDGILNAGLMFARTCMRGGLHVFACAEYPSLIRGGHNHLDVRITDRPLKSHTKHLSLLAALNKESVDRHAKKLINNGGIIYDSSSTKANPADYRPDIQWFDIPLMQLALANGGQIMRNVVAMGATVALTAYDLELFNNILRDNFKKKGDAVINANIAAAKAGYDYVMQKHKGAFLFHLPRATGTGEIFLSGNEAIAAGAIRAGCTFFAAYPMTPASSVLHTMAAMEQQYNLVVKHTEDEIAAMNMVVGAAFAGARAMTATSGGGFSLMVEGLGLAAQTETPIVVVEAMRPGPATGMATHSGQGDLRFVLHASTDEFPRIVLAPGDVEECFYLTFHAFNLAEKYQLPVIIMTDKYLGESYASVPEFQHQELAVDRGLLVTDPSQLAVSANGGYVRYKVDDTGLSPRAIPGVAGGQHVASSYEHDEHGFEREEEEIRVMMHEKRFRKLELATKEIPDPELIGQKQAELTILSWGSPKGPILEAMRLLSLEGIAVNFLQIKFISPFPVAKVEEVMKGARATVVVENNKTAQLAGIIREQTGLAADYKILKYDGRPFAPEQVYDGIRKILAAHGTVHKRELIYMNGA